MRGWRVIEGEVRGGRMEMEKRMWGRWRGQRELKSRSHFF